MSDARGFTLLEAILALALLAIVLTGLLPAFFVCLTTNTRNEERTQAAAVAQRAMENLRLQNPASLPSSGSSSPEFVVVGNREFEVVERYCVRSEYCGTDSRHLVVDVSYGGRRVISVESVFTRLR